MIWKIGLGLVALFALGASFILIEVWSALGSAPAREHQAEFDRSKAWNGENFENELPEVEPNLVDIVKAYWTNDAQTEPARPEDIPVRRRQADEFEDEADLRITWLGHSTMLVEIDGARILTDPMFGERASPSSFFGPKRFYEPPMTVDDLPRIDAVVISHDHYDHLDQRTVRQLIAADVPFFVPLGIGSHLEYWGVPEERVHELDWWQSSTIAGVELVCTPARHFSGRGVGTRNSTLWASWVLRGPDHRVYFSGDTAMFDGFSEIGEQYGPFDAAMMEVGAYNQMWADVHLGPEQAIDAHITLKGGVFVPVHWGTFNLALHAWTEPPERLIVASEKAGVTMVIPEPGQSFDPREPPKVVRWWPENEWQTVDEAPAVSSGLD